MAYTLNSGGQPKPYVYQEYPRRLYKWGEKPCSVGSDEERAAKEAEGWSIDQVFIEPPPAVVPDLRIGHMGHGGDFAVRVHELPAAEPEATADIRHVAEAPRRGRPRKVRA